MEGERETEKENEKKLQPMQCVDHIPIIINTLSAA